MQSIWIVSIGFIIGLLINKIFYNKEYINIIGLYIQLENLRKENGIKIVDDRGEELYGAKLKSKLEYAKINQIK